MGCADMLFLFSDTSNVVLAINAEAVISSLLVRQKVLYVSRLFRDRNTNERVCDCIFTEISTFRTVVSK
jgi:hypothetical protein